MSEGERLRLGIRRCLDCGRELNNHEWLYGACSSCIKKRAKRNGYKVRPKDGFWIYADNAPRWQEYGAEADPTGTVLLYRAVFGWHRDVKYDEMQNAYTEAPMSTVGNRGRPRKYIPEGMKACQTCGKAIPKAGPSRCEHCAERYREIRKNYEDRCREAHKCIRCGKQMPEDWPYKTCSSCQINHRKKKGAQDGEA